ncbi:rhomboid family intramembrane serine protease [Photobacterium proteolyticum]|uniref:Rhomboid family intramembrane serine protease n=1 Tax=Photobacterium proteolyticum TaxID=1903952 RepID=A0A1Q9G9X4_9GAMM|nr:rhomboid family intramembrane serine protease [Photobacterium proteolyticum]
MRQSDKDSLILIGFICLFTTAIHIANVFFRGQLNDYGLLPRHFSHFTGIVAYPFLHGSWAHLISNLVSFSVLGYLVSRSGLARLIAVFMISWAGSGVGVWIFGRMHFHVGLSGIIYGLWAYLLVYAVMYRSLKSIAIAVIVMFLYGSMVWGFIPAHSWVSYESHFFGAVAGVLAGYIFARRDKQRELVT